MTLESAVDAWRQLWARNRVESQAPETNTQNKNKHNKQKRKRNLNDIHIYITIHMIGPLLPNIRFTAEA
jgi:hypothetical protein